MMNAKVGDPRIKAINVDLEGKPFNEYHAARDTWRNHSDYLYPIPPHLFGPKEVIDTRTRTLILEHEGGSK